MVWEILLAVFCAIGLAACIRFAVGRLVYPVRGAIILLPALGDGRLLEQQLMGLTALSGEGKLDIDAIYLADAGLDSDGLAAAERLCRRYPELRFCAAERDIDQL